jgi:hypothetical protein
MALVMGSHVAYARGADLIVEWYDFGKDVPYESANLLIFSPEAQRALSASLGLEKPPRVRSLAREVAARFESYFQVREFASAQGIAFEKKVDFWP